MNQRKELNMPNSPTTSGHRVQRAWLTALRLGGTDEGAPGKRPQYGDDYYGAYCRDPEGNKLCFVFARSMATQQQ